MLTQVQIEQAFPAATVRRARALLNGGAVSILKHEMDEEVLNVEATVRDRMNLHEVSLSLDGSQMKTSNFCDCAEGSACPHMAAALLALIELSDDAPLSTEGAQRQRAITVLEMLSVPQMRVVAKRHGWKLKGTLKAEIIGQLAEQLLAALADGSLMAGLSPMQARMLATIHLVHDVNFGVDSAEIIHIYRNVLREKGMPKQLLSALFEYGLLARDSADSDTYYISTVPVSAYDIDYRDSNTPVLDIKLHPASRFSRGSQRTPPPPIQHVAAQLGQVAGGDATIRIAAQSWKGPKKSTSKAASPADWPITEKEARTMRGGTGYSHMFQERQVPFPLQTQILSEKSAEMLAPLLGSEDKADWLFEMLSTDDLNLFERQGEDRYQIQDESWQIFQSVPEAVQIRFFYNNWLESTSVQYELRRLRQEFPDWTLWRLLAPGLTYQYFGRDIAAAHQTVARFLGQVAVQSKGAKNDWVQLDQFVKRIGELKPHLYQSVAGAMAWGFSYKGKPVNNEANRRWTNTYGELVRHLFDGPLYWLGLVDLIVRNGRIDAFRITDLGRWLLSPASTKMADFVAADAQMPSKLAWEADGALKLERGYDFGSILTVVNQYMQADEDRPGYYRIDKMRLENAFAAGQEPDGIASAFVGVNAELPDEISAEISQMHTLYGFVHLYEELTVIEFSDEFALAELRAAELIELDDIVHEFSPQLIVINDSVADRIIAALQKKKYTPRVI